MIAMGSSFFIEFKFLLVFPTQKMPVLGDWNILIMPSRHKSTPKCSQAKSGEAVFEERSSR
jgi:hypothetical protein